MPKIHIEGALEPIPALDRLFHDIVEQIRAKVGEEGVITPAVSFRGKIIWSAVWILKSNNGFSIELESQHWIRLETWSHSGDMARATCTVRTLAMAKSRLPDLLPPELGLRPQT